MKKLGITHTYRRQISDTVQVITDFPRKPGLDEIVLSERGKVLVVLMPQRGAVAVVASAERAGSEISQ